MFNGTCTHVQILSLQMIAPLPPVSLKQLLQKQQQRHHQVHRPIERSLCQDRPRRKETRTKEGEEEGVAVNRIETRKQ